MPGLDARYGAVCAITGRTCIGAVGKSIHGPVAVVTMLGQELCVELGAVRVTVKTCSSRSALTRPRSARKLRSSKRAAHAIGRERFKWADKLMAGVVPDDIAAEKQRGLARDLAALEAHTARLALQAVDRDALARLFDLVADAGSVYRDGNPTLHRAMNQAWFRQLIISEDDEGISISDAEREPVTAAIQHEFARRREASQTPYRRRSAV